ncbi:MAG: YtxH domain-containing protein [Actinobacteria bacterium]|nr:YtxH domain-containing protein [Actinomycetota bacterium]
MRYRLVFFIGLGIGFVLGTRAGRERYEQMRGLARKVADNPSVQQAAGTLQAQAAGYAKTAGGKMADRAGAARAKVGEALHERVPGMRVRESDGSSADGGNGRYAPAPGAAGSPPGV